VYKIMAIGGGEIGRPGFPIETEKMDKEIIKLTGKKKPRLLFLPTASSDSAGDVEVVKKYFGKKLGCKIDTLLFIKNRLISKEIRRRIDKADMIYVGGGKTLFMLEIWKKRGVDKMLLRAAEKGTVLFGVSAGAICWFESGLSDSLKFADGSEKLPKSLLRLKIARRWKLSKTNVVP